MRRALALGCLVALVATAGSFAASAQAVRLSRPPPLARSNDALPRILAPATSQTARINRALASLDSHWAEFIRQCRPTTGGGSGAERKVTVVMAGPGFVSLRLDGDPDCGGAHPNVLDVALTYDLATGRPIDWTQMLPKSLVRSTTTDTSVDGTMIGAVVSPDLQALYKKAVATAPGLDADLRKDCADVIDQDGLGFQLWPDAAGDGVRLSPFDLPNVVAACAAPVTLSTASLRALGVDPALLDAIDAAHQARSRAR